MLDGSVQASIEHFLTLNLFSFFYIMMLVLSSCLVCGFSCFTCISCRSISFTCYTCRSVILACLTCRSVDLACCLCRSGKSPCITCLSSVYHDILYIIFTFHTQNPLYVLVVLDHDFSPCNRSRSNLS